MCPTMARSGKLQVKFPYWLPTKHQERPETLLVLGTHCKFVMSPIVNLCALSTIW